MSIDESWYRKPQGIEEHTSAGGVVVRTTGGRLFVALVREGRLRGYVLPKGHVEPGESVEDAARREIHEEAGLAPQIALGELTTRERLDYGRTSWKRTHYFLYVMSASTDTQGGRAEWFPLDALPPMFWPEQRELLETHREKIVRTVANSRAGDDRKRAVQQQFSRQAGAYARSASHRRDADLDLLLQYVQPVRSDRVLDVATGTGFTAFALRPLVRSVVGVDLTHGMLEEARRLAPAPGRIAWVAGDAEALPFADGTFSIVTCRRAPHHFQRIERGVDEMLRVLARGGRLGVVDQVPPESDPGCDLMETLEVARDSSHIRALRASRWQALLADRNVALTCAQVVESRQTVEAWLDLAGADDARRGVITGTLRRASREARDEIGYREDPEPSFLKRWVVLVGTKTRE